MHIYVSAYTSSMSMNLSPIASSKHNHGADRSPGNPFVVGVLVAAAVMAICIEAAVAQQEPASPSSFNSQSGLGAQFFGMLPGQPAVIPPAEPVPPQAQPFQFQMFQSYLPSRQDQLIVQTAEPNTASVSEAASGSGAATGPLGTQDPTVGAATVTNESSEPNPIYSLLDIDESDLVLPKAKEFRFGPFVLIPGLSILTGYDSNIAQSPKSSKRDSSTYFLIMPSLKLGLRARSSLSYDNTRWQYTSRSEYNTNNQVLAFNALNVFDVRNSLKWRVVLTDAYEQKGSTDSNAPSANRYRLWRYGGTYRYGAQGARGRIEADLFQSQREYLNNRLFTRSLDYDANEIALRLYARVMPKTSLFVETRNIDTDYRASQSTLLPGERDLSSVKRTNSVGATWRATAATSGTIKLGHTKADYSQRRDFSGGAYDLILNWEPRTYSRVELAGGRFVSDTTAENAADYILNRSIGAKWTHDWAGHWQSVIRLARLDSDYNGITRKDLINTRSLALYYKLKQWLSIGVEYSRYTRDSNNNDFDYERTEGGLSLRLNIF